MGRPKSTGCRTCRQRRVKCDENRPTCNRCENAGYDCEGYTRDYRFVEDPGTIRVVQRRTRVNLNPSLSGFEDNIYISYLLSSLSLQPLDTAVKNAPWLQVHAETLHSPVAKHSLSALSSLYFGRRHHHKDALNHGRQCYGKALLQLNAELRDPDKCRSISALSSATVLQIYEFVATDVEAGWLTHAGGTGRLVELRGPASYRAPAELRLFEDNRMTITLEHWKKGKRCFLEKPEWKSTPWALHPGSKTSFGHLQDILCDIPGLIEDVNNLKTLKVAPEERVSFAQNLVKNISGHLVQLYDWRTKWDEDHPDYCVQVQALQQAEQQEQEPPLFLKDVHFSTISSAHHIMYYDAILLMLLAFGFGVVGPSFDPRVGNYPLPSTAPHGPLALPGEALHPRVVAIELCQIAKDCLTDHSGSVGLWLISPMKTAHLFFPPTSREAKWLDVQMVAVADMSGFEIGRAQGIASRSESGK